MRLMDPLKVVADETVSRVHCIIVRSVGIWLRDMIYISYAVLKRRA